MVVRLFYAHILPALNDGALWHEMQDEANYCKANLLDALLTLPKARNEKMVPIHFPFVVRSSCGLPIDFRISFIASQCLPTSWQMAVDFQLFSIVYVSLSLCRYFKINETKVLLYFIGMSCIYTYCNIFYNEYIAILFINLR